MPKVTIITPNYNHARYLPKRLDSVFGQTFQDFELIILDNASTDRSREVIESYARDPRVRTIFNEQNNGSTFKQWNLGLSHARSEYVWFAEADDYAEPTLLETLVDRLDRHPNVGLSMCQSLVVDQDDRIMPGYLDYYADYFDITRFKSDYVNKGTNECENYLYYVNTIPNASAVLMRKSILERVWGKAVDMVLAGDWMTYACVLLVSDVAFVAAPMNYWRKHRDTVRSRTSTSSVEAAETRAIQRMLRDRLGSPELERVFRETCPGFVGHVVSKARRPPHNKVSPREAINLLKWFAEFEPRAFWIALPMLAKEQAADIARRLGILGPIRRMKHLVSSDTRV
jgi:glycosyltransferase involved in cell wall biosynthesis